jgi:hypothetical protein
MMSRKYVLIPILVTLVVLVVSIYTTETVTRRASAAPRAAVVTKYLLIPAAAFTPEHDGEDYRNMGKELRAMSGGVVFYAPVYLPNGARIRAFKLFAYDSNETSDIGAYLNVSYPKVVSGKQLGSVITTGSSGYQQPIKYLSHYVKWYYGYYIRVAHYSSTGLVTSAVMIRYTVNQ